ncbi:guanine deaminase [Nesterenkonia sp. PF2B19]|uniref:guanine deaminase n=1 Tax=Nesterenkonia sp. PF2B19 TaxID=1881858 RepID=UPI0008733E4B|nr:guanine deaminase [Nesterenkonia sp. PF2B19]OSM43276.1 guanine deaminase [Nesterenkonia sp. PF2B19]
MTIYRAQVLDTPGELGDPDALRADHDCALVVEDGVIVARTGLDAAVAGHPGHEVVDLRDGVLLPGLVDTHVHFPQIRVIGGLGMPLLEWLDQCALPEEERLAEATHAQAVAEDFLSSVVRSGTTSALVFGSHFPAAMDALFTQAERIGLRMTSGLVVSDRLLPESLLVTPERALEAGRTLAGRWHGRGRLRYAVTPRFSLSASQEMLRSCGELLAAGAGTGPGDEGLWFTSHVNENPAEIAAVRELFPEARDYVDTYDRAGLLSSRAVLAHDVHPTEEELVILGERGAAVAHCPTSNFSLGSGLFPWRRHRDAGVPVALGTDVGAGAGFFLVAEGLQAYFGQRLLGAEGLDLRPSDLLHLATRSGAQVLGLAEEIGDLSVGRQFDAVLVRPQTGGTLEQVLPYARDAQDVVAKIFSLGSAADVAGVWIGGAPVG